MSVDVADRAVARDVANPPLAVARDVAEPHAVARDVFSATLGSLCCCYSGQPLDTIKVRMQTSPLQYGSIPLTIAQIGRNEGILAFWKGSVPTAVGMLGENVVAFAVNEALKRKFPDDPKANDNRPDLLKPFLLGPITGCCAALVLLPGEIIKAKTQVVVGTGTTSKGIFRRMLKQQGIKSMFCGLDGQLMRDGSFYTLFFGGYEVCKYSIKSFAPSVPNEVNYFISGGLAGMMGWTIGLPFDVPKTVVQSRWDTKIVGSYFPVFFQIARERGIAGLYSGLGPALMRAFVANATLFLGVETGRRLFDSAL